MASNFKDEQEKLREKRELLKLKQGLIEESDVVEDYELSHDYVKPTGSKSVENFFYHYKWHVIAIAFAALMIGVMVVQTVTREKNDLYVLAVSTQNKSGIYVKQMDIENALEQYCPDFDGNGYVHVGVNFINLSVEGGLTEYSDAEGYKFNAELFTGDAQMFLADDGILEKIYEIAEGEIELFIDFSEQYPDETFYEGQGLQLNTTDFTESAKWTSCPDMVGLYIRGEFDGMTGNAEDIKEQRERALEVYNNIITGNIVNPPVEE